MSPFFRSHGSYDYRREMPLKHSIVNLRILSTPAVEPEMKSTRGTLLCQSIYAGIHDRTLQCMICYENLSEESQIWHCRRCWRVYHYECVLDWAVVKTCREGQEAPILPNDRWKCPTCRHNYWGLPLLKCWCRSTDGTSNLPDSSFNSCGYQCKKSRSSCVHLCNQTCHPGPCETCARCPTFQGKEYPDFDQSYDLSPTPTDHLPSSRLPPQEPADFTEELHDLVSDPNELPAARLSEIQAYFRFSLYPLICGAVWIVWIGLAIFGYVRGILES